MSTYLRLVGVQQCSCDHTGEERTVGRAVVASHQRPEHHGRVERRAADVGPDFTGRTSCSRIAALIARASAFVVGRAEQRSNRAAGEQVPSWWNVRR